MTDAALEALIAELESCLQADAVPSPEALEAWSLRWQASLPGAERGAGWAALVQRAHTLAQRLDQRVGELVVMKEALRRELQGQELGNRALKAYRQP